MIFDLQDGTEWLVIYHASCRDGFCAAWLFHRAFEVNNTQAQFVSDQYAGDERTDKYDDLKKQVKNRNVAIVDFSYSFEKTKALLEEYGAKKVVVLDHHTTAEDQVNRFIDYANTPAASGSASGVFDLNRSGAGLALDFLEFACEGEHLDLPERGPKREDWIARYVQDRDLWRFELPDSKAVNAYLSTLPLRFKPWNETQEKPLQEVVTQGEFLLSYQKEVQSANNRRSHWCEISDGKQTWSAPAVNATALISETLHDLGDNQPFAVGYFVSNKLDVVVSLRSPEDGEDVGVIAKAMGGGGHKHAAGFRLPLYDLGASTSGRIFRVQAKKDKPDE